MQINIRTKNLESSDAINEYVHKKVSELDKYINVHVGELEGGRGAVEAFVELERTTQHHKKGDIFRSEIQIVMPVLNSVRAESTQADLYASIDEAKDEIQRQLRKYQGKIRTNRQRNKQKFKKLLHISELVRFRKEK